MDPCSALSTLGALFKEVMMMRWNRKCAHTAAIIAIAIAGGLAPALVYGWVVFKTRAESTHRAKEMQE